MLKEIIKTNVNGNIDKKICLISDIHYYNNYNKKVLNLIIDNITLNKPDYICITGDIIDKPDLKKDEYSTLISFLTSLAKITKVIAILGNHDITIDHELYENLEYIKSIKNIKGLYLLMNEEIIFDNIRFIGYYDTSYSSFHDKASNIEVINEFNKLFSHINIKDNKYNILLAHNPIYIIKDEVFNNIDSFKYLSLILSGHTHGGLLPNFIKGHRGIISPSMKLFPKNIRGIYKKEKTNIVISNGIIKLSKTANYLSKFNFLFPVTINYIDIKKES